MKSDGKLSNRLNARISKTFDKKHKEQTFKKGNLLLAVRRSMVMMYKTKGKFQPKWVGLFIMECLFKWSCRHLKNNDW